MSGESIVQAASGTDAAKAASGGFVIRNRQDFVAGLLFAATGGILAFISSGYEIGTAHQMGPGFAPLCLALLLAATGAMVALTALGRSGPQTGLPSWEFKPALIVLGSTALAGFLLPRAGLVATIVVLVLASSRASHEYRFRGALGCAAAVVAICLFAFGWLLDLPLPIWPELGGE